MSDLQPAYILHRRVWRETSLILDVYSASYGRLSILARGALRKRGLGAELQPFQPLKLSWTGKSELKTLTQCENSERLPVLQGQDLLSGMYVNELILKFCPLNDINVEVFIAYAEMISNLRANLHHALRKFELHLLHSMGLSPDFCVENNGSAISADGYYQVHPMDGIHSAQQYEDRTFSGDVLLACHQFKPEITEKQKEMRNLMRLYIDFHLQGKELKTRTLSRQMKQWST